MRLALFALAFMALAGCVSVPVTAVQCPPLAQYTQLEQDQLAAELPKDGEETVFQIEDYVKLRQACRNQTNGN